jgi:hypothetical protein
MKLDIHKRLKKNNGKFMTMCATYITTTEVFDYSMFNNTLMIYKR